MEKLKARYEKWKSRTLLQKFGDIFFWGLLVLLIIPGPRKVITTGAHSLFLHLKHPTLTKEESRIQLNPADFEWNIRTGTGEAAAPDSFMGEVVFLNFWATWCPPCIAELPEIQNIYNAYGDRVKFVLITNQQPDEVEKFLSDRGYTLPVYYGGNNLPEKLQVRSIPTTYIISGDGSIVSKKIGAINWDSKATRRIFDSLLDQAVLR